jgi:hypothetical protein
MCRILRGRGHPRGTAVMALGSCQVVLDGGAKAEGKIETFGVAVVTGFEQAWLPSDNKN